MNRFRFVHRFFLMFRLSVIATGLFVQVAASAEYEPRVGQPGKDVEWVPTCQVLVDRMLDVARVTWDDYVIDLGPVDGRTVITAAKRGARALGIEYNPDLIELSKRNAAKEAVTDRGQFIEADLFEGNFSEAAVITMFLTPEINLKPRPLISHPAPVLYQVPSQWESGCQTRPLLWRATRTAASIIRLYSGLCRKSATDLETSPGGTPDRTKLPENSRKNQVRHRYRGDHERKSNNPKGRVPRFWPWVNENTPESLFLTSAGLARGYLHGDRISFSAGNVKYIGRVKGMLCKGPFSPAERLLNGTRYESASSADSTLTLQKRCLNLIFKP